MAKGFYSQGVSILMNEAVSINTIKQVIEKEFEVVKVIETAEQWVFSGPSLVIPFRTEVNGYATVDIVDRPWPDDMVDPKENVMLFGAWSMGHFGPYTFPKNLERAAQQSWIYADGAKAAQGHRAFIRIRITYVLGNIDSKAPVLPKDYEPLSELIFILKISRRLLDLSAALCYFNPSGECLVEKEVINELLERYENTGLPPFEAIANIRMYNLPQDNEWLMMDTVGMSQLDVSDQEVIFRRDMYNPNDVANFLRNSSDYIFDNGPVIKNGDTMDGPGGIRWQGATFEQEIASPPREVLRWFPMDNKKRPYGLQGEVKDEKMISEELSVKEDESKEKKKGFFSKLFGKKNSDYLN